MLLRSCCSCSVIVPSPQIRAGRRISAVEKRRVMVTQLLRSPVLNAAGEQVGRVEDFIAKLADSGYPPITGLKVGVGGHDVFVGPTFGGGREAERVKPKLRPAG